MTHPGHNITHCVHGTIVSQCRCAIKDKPSVVVECPKNCDARRVHLAGSDEVFRRVENQLYAMRNDGWDLRPFIALAAALREARDKSIRFDLDQAGIELREREAVELVELRAALREAREDTKRLDFAVSHGWLSVPFQEHGIWYSRSSGTRVDIDAAMKPPGGEGE